MPPVLRLQNITKRFGALTANDTISFSLGVGEIVALLGENGAGKTTLMNILFGHYVADAGTVEVFGKTLRAGDPRAALNAGVGMVHQHFTLADNLTVLDNIVLGTRSLWSPRLGRDAARAKLARLAEDFGLAVDPNRVVGTLTVGERQRVEIVKALYRDAKILILDEPTAVLTPAESEALFATLKRLVAGGLSVIFISHKLNEVMTASDRVIVLRGGAVVGERVTAQTNAKELAGLMVGRDILPPRAVETLRGAARLKLEGVSTSGHAGTPLRDVTLDIRSGEITGLAGVSGNGQAELAALIAGMIAPASGTMTVVGAAVGDWSPREAMARGIGRIPEDRHATGAIGDMSVAENLILERYRTPRFARSGFLRAGAVKDFAATAIRDYEVKCPSPDARIRLLSGGNMQKLILARALDGDPAVILASQPTRGLDVGAVAYVHERLLAARARGAAILLISEDLDEVRLLSDRIVVMVKGRVSVPAARGKLSVAEIGAMMAGQGFETEETAEHAA